MASRPQISSLDQARQHIATKLQRAGAKGADSPITPNTPREQRILFEEALREMTAANEIVAIGTGTKNKFFLREFRPSLENATAKIERYAAVRHPALLDQFELGKALVTAEKALLAAAIESLESNVRLVRLVRGGAVVFAHADSLRAALGVAASTSTSSSRESSSPSTLVAEPVSMNGRRVRDAYQTLVRRSGFLDVEIAALWREAGVRLADLKAWLEAEHRDGRADFYLGDWSLADDAAREAAIVLRGERYLLTRLEE